MSLEWAALLHYGLISLVILTGLHGIFSQTHLLKKTMAWGFFQAGIILLFVSVAEKTEAKPPLLFEGAATGVTHYLNPLPHALALGVLVVSLAVGVILALLASVLFRETGRLDEDFIDQELLK